MRIPPESQLSLTRSLAFTRTGPLNDIHRLQVFVGVAAYLEGVRDVQYQTGSSLLSKRPPTYSTKRGRVQCLGLGCSS